MAPSSRNLSKDAKGAFVFADSLVIVSGSLVSKSWGKKELLPKVNPFGAN